ncbi:MAG: GMC family oxidoreductase [Polyangiaceae bacterium]|nr:GMC family oxidoreductase [Polyangiaceae bacterium]
MSHFDVVVIGSGFGGSVSALRLVEKGYRVLVLEKGKRYAPSDFPKTNWDLRRWMWRPELGLTGIFQMSFLEHVTVLHGVGVGGGSLVYANTLPTPKDPFFEAASWSSLASWKKELEPHYATARRMLGVARNPMLTKGDEVLRSIAKELGREEYFHATDVGVYFGKPEVRVPDPYFGGRGPERVGCNFCGACMTGCRVGAKNTLDMNYLYLAQKGGATVVSETEVTAVRARREGGYQIDTSPSFGRGEDTRFTADRVVFAGGVMGTVPLLLGMREDPHGLPHLSARVGDGVRTNSEALAGVVVPDRDANFSKGVAITSILHTDEHSHIEPVRYSAGSGFFRTMILPQTSGSSLASRLGGAAKAVAMDPLRWLKAYTVRDFAKQSQVLLYMRTLEGTLSMRLGRNIRTGFRRGLVTKLDDPSQAPQANIPEALDLARRFAEKVGGVSATLLTETVLGVPSTAHILGGACMGQSADDGVIDARHRVHGYDGLFVIDGSAVSANPGVNPSLTITALAERAMSFIPAKGHSQT